MHIPILIISIPQAHTKEKPCNANEFNITQTCDWKRSVVEGDGVQVLGDHWVSVGEIERETTPGGNQEKGGNKTHHAYSHSYKNITETETQ